MRFTYVIFHTILDQNNLHMHCYVPYSWI